MQVPHAPSPQPEWRPRPAGREIAIHIRLDRAMLVAAILSLLIHLLLLFTYQKHLLDMKQAPTEGPPIVMELSLDKPLIKPPLPLPAPAVPPAPQQPRKPRQVKTPAAPKLPEAPKVIATESSPLRLPVESPPLPKPQAPSPAPTAPAAPTDMMSYMAMMRERRRQAEAASTRENAEATPRERAPTEDERRNEIIKRNLQTGTSGIFTITNLSSSHAQFIFKGWTSSASNARSEVIQVEAMPDEDIKRKIVQKMIEIIRRHYSGYFNWDSQRLQRVIVLSARQEDNDGLEDFIMSEFF